MDSRPTTYHRGFTWAMVVLVVLLAVYCVSIQFGGNDLEESFLLLVWFAVFGVVVLTWIARAIVSLRWRDIGRALAGGLASCLVGAGMLALAPTTCEYFGWGNWPPSDHAFEAKLRANEVEFESEAKALLARLIQEGAPSIRPGRYGGHRFVVRDAALAGTAPGVVAMEASLDGHCVLLQMWEGEFHDSVLVGKGYLFHEGGAGLTVSSLEKACALRVRSLKDLGAGWYLYTE